MQRDPSLCHQRQGLNQEAGMLVEENFVRGSKTLYKVMLLLLKYLPVATASLYMFNTALYWFGINFELLSTVAGMSVFSWIFIYIASVVFKFCIYQRLLLWYILTSDLISAVDYYISIPIETHWMLSIQSVLIGIVLIVIVIIHVRNGKKGTVADN